MNYLFHTWKQSKQCNQGHQWAKGPKGLFGDLIPTWQNSRKAAHLHLQPQYTWLIIQQNHIFIRENSWANKFKNIKFLLLTHPVSSSKGRGPSKPGRNLTVERANKSPEKSWRKNSIRSKLKLITWWKSELAISSGKSFGQQRYIGTIQGWNQSISISQEVEKKG